MLFILNVLNLTYGCAIVSEKHNNYLSFYEKSILSAIHLNWSKPVAAC